MAWAADQGGPTPYWRDIGTLDSYFSANMDLVSITPEFNLYDESWPIRTYKGQFPPPKTVFDTEGRTGAAMNSLLSGGVIVSGSRVERSILSPNVRVHSYGHVEGCVIFEGVEIERGCRLKGCIVDKDVRIPAGTTLGYDLAEDRKRFHVTDEGVVVVPKGYDFSNVS